MSRLFETSSPRDDLRSHPEAVEQRPGMSGETSLQQCDKSKVLQWHCRTAVFWKPRGEPFWIDEAAQTKEQG